MEAADLKSGLDELLKRTDCGLLSCNEQIVNHLGEQQHIFAVRAALQEQLR